jgi:hypothetical protein
MFWAPSSSYPSSSSSSDAREVAEQLLASSFTTNHTFYTVLSPAMSHHSISHGLSPIPSDHEFPAPAFETEFPPLPQSSAPRAYSSRITLAHTPPMFNALTKSKWDTFFKTLDNYLWAYKSKFDMDKKKISFTISLMGKEDGTLCPASNWVRNWRRRTLCLRVLRARYIFAHLVQKLDQTFQDQNFK